MAGRNQKESHEFVNTFIEERVSFLLPQFEKLAPYNATKRKNGDVQQQVTGWKKLASRETVVLKDRYPDERKESEKTYTTATTQLSKLRKGLLKASKTDLKDSANVYKVETIINHFHQELVSHFSSYKERENIEYRQRVDKRSDSEKLIEVDLTAHLEKANKVLSALVKTEDNSEEKIGDTSQAPIKPDWRDVSCALALVTGRRQSEIHYSASFTAVDEYEVEFRGQLKGKTRKEQGKAVIDASFMIPTLVKAELVVNALDWLETQGKRVHSDDAVDIINGRWGKPLSQRVKEGWEVIKDEQWQEIDTKDKMTYHKLRGVYLVCALENLDNTGKKMLDKAKYGEKILGDKDLKAIKPYERVKLKPDSLTKI